MPKESNHFFYTEDMKNKSMHFLSLDIAFCGIYHVKKEKHFHQVLQIEIVICAYRFGQATLVHVIIACASLSASTGMVNGPWSTGHTIAVVAGVGWVVASVGMVMMLVVAVVMSKYTT